LAVAFSALVNFLSEKKVTALQESPSVYEYVTYKKRDADADVETYSEYGTYKKE
jgi:hypothetical protein